MFGERQRIANSAHQTFDAKYILHATLPEFLADRAYLNRTYSTVNSCAVYFTVAALRPNLLFTALHCV